MSRGGDTEPSLAALSAAAALAAMLSVASATAQSVRGQVLDDSTGSAIGDEQHQEGRMPRTRTVVLSILGGLVLVVALVAAVGVTWWKRNGAALINEGRMEIAGGRQAGKGILAGRCVELTLERHAQAPPSMRSTLMESSFLTGCLETADSLPALCATNPEPGIIGDAKWAVGVCSRRGLTDRYCAQAVQPVMKACRRPTQQPSA